MITKYIDFKKYSSIKVGQKEKVFILESIEDFDDDFFVIGGANNILISPNPPRLAKLDKSFDYIKLTNDTLIVGAATLGSKLYNFAKRYNLSGFEMLSKIPGQMGGIVKMNAGLKEYEISKNILWVNTSKSSFTKNECNFKYRNTAIKGLIYEIVFKRVEGFSKDLSRYLETLRKNQPKEPSCGSFFKNPKGDYAARLIEKVGLKGYRVGNMAWSDKHANFLVNLGDGKFDEAYKLIDLAKNRVYEEFGINLESEVVIL